MFLKLPVIQSQLADGTALRSDVDPPAHQEDFLPTTVTYLPTAEQEIVNLVVGEDIELADEPAV